MPKCAVCNDTGEYQVNILKRDGGELHQTGAYLKPCPFGCPIVNPVPGVSGNGRLKGKEIQLSKADLERMRKNDKLRQDAKMLENHAKKGQVTNHGDYTENRFSVPIEDYYGLKKRSDEP